MDKHMENIEIASSFLLAAHTLIEQAIDVLDMIGINMSYEEAMKKMMEAYHESRTDGIQD